MKTIDDLEPLLVDGAKFDLTLDTEEANLVRDALKQFLHAQQSLYWSLLKYGGKFDVSWGHSNPYSVDMSNPISATVDGNNVILATEDLYEDMYGCDQTDGRRTEISVSLLVDFFRFGTLWKEVVRSELLFRVGSDVAELETALAERKVAQERIKGFDLSA